jgi:hypothetical protein
MSLTTVIMIVAIILFVLLPSLKDRIIPVKKLAITPAIFMYLFYQNITQDFYLDLDSQIMLIVGVLFGVAAGIMLRINTRIKTDKNQKLIGLPGTYSNIIVFLLIFSVHFVMGYLQSVKPALFHVANATANFLIFMLAFSSSITVGASLCLFYKYYRAPAFQL